MTEDEQMIDERFRLAKKILRRSELLERIADARGGVILPRTEAEARPLMKLYDRAEALRCLADRLCSGDVPIAAAKAELDADQGRFRLRKLWRRGTGWWRSLSR